MHEELRQAVYGHLSQTLPLAAQPFFAESSSEGSAPHDVNVNVDVEGDGVAVQHQAGRIGRGESSPQYEQASAEAAARLRL